MMSTNRTQGETRKGENKILAKYHGVLLMIMGDYLQVYVIITSY